jgi:D-glycero-D-manno-heptose 1,7-bisphosphate phosphatase
MNKAVFLDKDGTVIEDVPYNTDPAKVKLSGSALTGLKKVQHAGYLLIIISNQPGIAKGYFTGTALLDACDRMRKLLADGQIYLDGLYYCPHHPQGIIEKFSSDCDCHKPRPGMLLKAARDHNIDLRESWMVGDILNDVEAGKKAGCRTILINNGNETEWITDNEWRNPDYLAKDLDEMATIILSAKN